MNLDSSQSHAPAPNRPGASAGANLALALAAFFWGTTFIFQRQAMEHLEPFAYGGLRFIIGALALMPLVLPRALRQWRESENPQALGRIWLKSSLLCGTLIFVGVGFQQYGLIWTTAGKAGFITSLYVVLLPIILRFMGHQIVLGEALGAILALAGLYLLSFTGLFTLSLGDGLVLVGAFVWAAHVLSVAYLAPRQDCLILGAGQALICGLWNLAATLVFGQWPAWAQVSAAWLDLLWGSLFSVTLGFTLQVVGQKNAKPVPAAIILQMEAVVAVLAGCLMLGEIMTGRMIAGALLMLAGMLTCQIYPLIRAEKA